MEREGMLILHEIETDTYCCVKEVDVVKGFLHETYNNWGQLLSPDEAGDYTFGNSEFEKKLEVELREKYDVLSDAVFYFNENGIYDYDCDLTDEEKKQINDFINRFHFENCSVVQATYYNHWDGSNCTSVIIDCNEYCPNDFEIVEDEELFNEIFDDFDESFEKEELNGIRYFEGEKYYHRISHWQSDPFFFESEKKII